jgi:hypothetical protein
VKGDRKVFFLGHMGHSWVNFYGLGLFGKANIHNVLNIWKRGGDDRLSHHVQPERALHVG